MSRFMVGIQRTGDKPSCHNWTNQEEVEFFKHTGASIWGVVEAENAVDAIQKLVEHAYENDLWYGIGSFAA